MCRGKDFTSFQSGPGLPGSLEIKSSTSSTGVVGLILGQGAKTPHASRPKKQNIKNRSSAVTNSIKTLKVVHI